MADSETTFTVRGETVDEAEITDALEEFRGVQLVEVDAEEGRVEVRYGEELHSEKELEDAVRDLGYEVVE